MTSRHKGIDALSRKRENDRRTLIIEDAGLTVVMSRIVVVIFVFVITNGRSEYRIVPIFHDDEYYAGCKERDYIEGVLDHHLRIPE